VSFVFPHALVRRLDVIAHEQTVGDRSVIVRKILSDHIEEYEGDAPNKVSVTLPEEVTKGLLVFKELTGKDRASAVQEVVVRYLASAIADARKTRAELSEQLHNRDGSRK